MACPEQGRPNAPIRLKPPPPAGHYDTEITPPEIKKLKQRRGKKLPLRSKCAALVGEDQPLCPDLPELDLSELDVSDLDADSFLGGLKWYSDQSEIISSQYGNEASNLFEPCGIKSGQGSQAAAMGWGVEEEEEEEDQGWRAEEGSRFFSTGHPTMTIQCGDIYQGQVYWLRGLGGGDRTLWGWHSIPSVTVGGVVLSCDADSQ
ncbi:hypothetical protein SKAU_G00343670 [Synaphobranchus kaupii]|uniref:Uncharacterized protein n=1 Tax=Synaphobranchus kaupii TaxID=118154 RepID=A0A9Q1IHI0_SYNKA|nr:hypothetical protein SKAU_G00343670 [Synaphobranchus kaupii]